MSLQNFKYKKLFLVSFFFLSVSLQAEIPDGYYQNANGKKTAVLKTALYNIIKNHTVREYYDSSNSFRSTDWHPATDSLPNGYFWDMYSNYKRTSWSGMNREHSMPKSWWSTAPETTVAYSDLHNLYPSDATANSAKLNYPLGEVVGTPEFANGVIKVGQNGLKFVAENNNVLKYNGTVFEPADEYKGDFARDYMYVVTCYENYATEWRSTGTESMLIGGSTYPVFKPWADSLLLKWHRQDPVSEKETVRNNAVYILQKNRNPFIDHPELAEFIWGKYMGEAWLADGTLPVNFIVQPNPVDSFLTVKVKYPQQATYFVKSINGITVKTGNLSVGGVEVGEIKNGIYILEVYTGTERKVTKFIVRH